LGRHGAQPGPGQPAAQHLTNLDHAYLPVRHPSSTSVDMERSETAVTSPTRRDTPGGPITGNRVVPSPWQKPAQGGPMIVAGDMRSALRRRLPTPVRPDDLRRGLLRTRRSSVVP